MNGEQIGEIAAVLTAIGKNHPHIRHALIVELNKRINGWAFTWDTKRDRIVFIDETLMRALARR